MSSGNAAGLVAALTTSAGLVAAVLGIFKYFNYRTKRDRIAAVGTAFEAVVEALASDDEVKRMAAAIRLRRFFDPRAELATGGLWPWLRRLRRRDDGYRAEQATQQDAIAGKPPHVRPWTLTSDELPYAADALNVIVAILRGQPPGNFQKLLADALTKAPKELLAGADIQKANLQNAWLGRIDLPGADFFRADLSNASFKEATAQAAVFYEARLTRTRFTRAKLQEANFFGADLSRAEFNNAVLAGATFDQTRATRATFRGAQLHDATFSDADLREADFSDADLAGATFDGAQLARARFDGAQNVPDPILHRLGEDGLYPEDADGAQKKRRVFLSQPAVLTVEQQILVDRIAHLIEQDDVDVVRLRREEYPASGSLAEIRRLMSGCSGLVIVGVRQLTVADGTLRPGTPEEAQVRNVALATPWNQIEAGMAFALELPMLVVSDHLADAGVFGLRDDTSSLAMIDLAISDMEDVDNCVREWLRTLSSF
jgi:uncharacterized protein YjbI with pentapeptide repeats